MSGSHRSLWRDALATAVVAILAGRAVLAGWRHAGAADDGVTDQDTDRHGVAAPPDQRAATETPPGVHLLHPSVWPCVLAAGTTLLLFGVVSSLSFSVVGLLLIVSALGGWIGDLLHD